MKQNLGRIETGSKVAIVGGGPAGSFFALYLLKYARELGIHPEITIYEPRNLTNPGPPGCKGCAGILSMAAFRNLDDLDLTLPEAIIQRRIEHYTVHSSLTSITISKPEKDMQIASIYRGGGPLISHGINIAGFDDWLMEEAKKRGAKVQEERVDAIHLDEKARIAVAGRELEYDLLVLASGVNSAPIKIIGLEYLAPKTRKMSQDEIFISPDEEGSRLGNTAHAFLIPHSGVIFGTLVPKGSFVNVSVLSQGGHSISVKDFLKLDSVQPMLPGRYEHACGCRPKATVSSARNYFADGFVSIGDAAVSRLYKDGIGSSLLTAREAARVVAYHGLSRGDFERYYQPLCLSIDRDNRWGRLLFAINGWAKDSRLFLLAQHRLIGDEQNNTRGRQPFTKAAWGMFTGSYSYRNIASMTLNPVSIIKFSRALFQESLKSLFRQQITSPRQLHVGGKKVLILGSGFGGTYVLKHLVRTLNRNENVEITMVSDENYFLFSPLLHEVAMGRIDSNNVAYPVRKLHWRDRFNFVQANVRKIELEQRRVITSRGSFDFDYLVLALGSVTDTSYLNRISDSENVFTLKTLDDSRLIRNHVISLFEQASTEKEATERRQLLTFVVCGGGHIGVQLATELRDFIYRSLLKFYRVTDAGNIRIILVEAEEKIGADLHPNLSAHVMSSLKRIGIDVRLKSKVTRISKGSVEINGSEIVPTNTVIWVAGVVANPLIAELAVNRDYIGRVLVDDYLALSKVPGVYAVGDCAHFQDPRSGQPAPPRAHIAVRQAKTVAYNILSDIRGRDRQKYHYSNNAEAVSLGSSDAVVRLYGLRMYGFLASILWLIGYSSLVSGIPNRIRIIMDWLLSSVFGRDVTLTK
jgi:NADH dehydrogenase